MNIKDIIKKDRKEVISLLEEKRKTLKDFRFGISGTKTRNTREGRGLKRDIAKILTVLKS